MGAAVPNSMNHNQVGMHTTHDSLPVHRVYVDGFWMDRTEVTNAQFTRFVAATGYVTIAEKAPSTEEFPDAPSDMLVPGSILFTPPNKPLRLDNHLRWWAWVKGRQLAPSRRARQLHQRTRKSPCSACVLCRC
ncbi:Sulfatase-modifying factor enzyme 1 [Nitrosomonas sp. Nm132]|nr:Sulfatase-modifying factor enzyme 1 [Nitrosomonas sp. Nm132]